MANFKAPLPVTAPVRRLVLDAYARLRGACPFRARHTALLRAAGCLVWTAGLLSACGEAPAGRSAVPAVVQERSAGTVDWSRRATSFRSPGWTLEFCEGEGPFLCVARGSERVGSVELSRFPVRDHAVIAEILRRGGSEREALEAAAAEFVSVLTADRRVGHGGGYQLRADPPAPATVMGKPGLRLVLEGRLAGRLLERIVQYHAIDRDTFYLLAATGTDGGGRLGEFETGHLRAFEPVFGEIAAVSSVSTVVR